MRVVHLKEDDVTLLVLLNITCSIKCKFQSTGTLHVLVLTHIISPYIFRTDIINAQHPNKTNQDIAERDGLYPHLAV